MKKYETINLPEIMEQEKLQAVTKIQLSPQIKELSRKYVIESSASTGEGGGGGRCVNQPTNTHCDLLSQHIRNVNIRYYILSKL